MVAQNSRYGKLGRKQKPGDGNGIMGYGEASSSAVSLKDGDGGHGEYRQTSRAARRESDIARILTCCERVNGEEVTGNV